MPIGSSCPKFVAPQVPILSAEPPEGDGWIHEIKHDGFRTLLRIDRSDVRAFTRGGHDWTDKYGG
jgi:bifunctional non-homologous end joining protein LigD